MRRDPLTPADLLRALERFGPRARPYNFEECFDCFDSWGLVRRVFDHLDDGFETDEELRGPGDAAQADWVAFTGPGGLVSGDLLRAGHTYSWYITVTAADRRTAFAPSDGVFRIAGEG